MARRTESDLARTRPDCRRGRVQPVFACTIPATLPHAPAGLPLCLRECRKRVISDLRDALDRSLKELPAGWTVTSRSGISDNRSVQMPPPFHPGQRRSVRQPSLKGGDPVPVAPEVTQMAEAGVAVVAPWLPVVASVAIGEDGPSPTGSSSRHHLRSSALPSPSSVDPAVHRTGIPKG